MTASTATTGAKRPVSISAFTLVELLVVITIIVVLLSLLVPAMESAVDLGRRARCASNQHQFVVGMMSYYADHQQRLMGMNTRAPATWVGPSLVQLRDNQVSKGTLHIKRMSAYLGWKIDIQTYDRGILYCPSENPTWAAVMRGPQWQIGDIHMGYSYFANVGEWERASDPRGQAMEQLTDKIPSSSRIFLSDELITLLPSNGWKLNHGKKGARDWAPGSPKGMDVRELAGLNQATGDGAVRWKPGEQMNLESLQNPATYTGGWLRHWSNGITAY